MTVRMDFAVTSVTRHREIRTNEVTSGLTLKVTQQGHRVMSEKRQKRDIGVQISSTSWTGIATSDYMVAHELCRHVGCQYPQ